MAEPSRIAIIAMQTATERVHNAKRIGLSIWVQYPDKSEPMVFDVADDATVGPFLLSCIDRGASEMAILGFTRQSGGVVPLVVYSNPDASMEAAYIPMVDGTGRVDWRTGEVLSRYSHLYRQARAPYN